MNDSTINKLSIVIPAYYEPYLDKTIKSIFDNVTTEIEVIVILDGWQTEQLDERVKVIKLDEHKGMREAINAGIEMAQGEFIMKTDAHCAFAEGFDKTLIDSYQDGWLVIPRRYSLNEANWSVKHRSFPYDYEYLSFPEDKGIYGYCMIPLPVRKINNKKIDDTMIFQGSCWFTKKRYFKKYVGRLNQEKFGSFGGEQMEIGLNFWLKGGAVKTNKNTWYAHLSKTKRFHLDNNKTNYNIKRSLEVLKSRELLTKHFMNNEDPSFVHPFEWLVQKFWPINGWFDDWQKIVKNIKYKYI